jgi:hypothetical protein
VSWRREHDAGLWARLWARRCAVGGLCLLVGHGLGRLLEPSAARATSCIPAQVEHYELTLAHVEALDGGDAILQRTYWAADGEYHEPRPCDGELHLTHPWWTMRVECGDKREH